MAVPLRLPRRRSTGPAGLDVTHLDRAGVDVYLAGLGPDGKHAASLDRAAEAELAALSGLSPLGDHMAVTYLDRISRPIPGLGLAAGVYLVSRGYAAHLAVEADPAAYGAADVPVLGTLPGGPGEQVPRDLLTRLVRATRRPFPHLRAVSGGVWDGLVAATAWRVNRTDPRDEPDDGAPLDPEERAWIEVPVVDGLVRLGWILRQADLHYGLEPDRRRPD